MDEAAPLPLMDELRAFFASLGLDGAFSLWRFDWEATEDTAPAGEGAVRVVCRAQAPGWIGPEERRPAASCILPRAGLEGLLASHGPEGLHAFLAGHAHQVLTRLVVFLLDESLHVAGAHLWNADARTAQAKVQQQRVQQVRRPALVGPDGNPVN